MDEARYRGAEQKLWEFVGTTPTEKRVHLQSTGLSVRVQEVGSGPATVFVHGVNVSGASWATLAARLHDFRCILLDRPGTGLSDPLPTALDAKGLPTFAEGLLIDLLDALELESAHVVATSFGGYIALRTAAAHPDRIDRMVQFSWPVGASTAKVPAMMRMMSVPGLGRLFAALPPNKRAVRMMFRRIGHGASLDAGRITQETLDWWLALLRYTDTTRNEVAMARGFFSWRGLDPRIVVTDEALSEITTPTCFVWGENDPFGGIDVARRLTERVPNAELDLLPEAGHAPWLDHLDRAATTVATFLRR